MNNWQQLLRDSDPAADAAMSEEDAQAIRRVVVVTAVHGSTAAVRWWPRRVALAAMVVVVVVSGAIAGRRLAPPQTAITPVPSATASAPEEPRQLQFATPGGTRIIWTFNPDFDLKETIP